jgi:murein L,D-transpeptidase YafK
MAKVAAWNERRCEHMSTEFSNRADRSRNRSRLLALAQCIFLLVGYAGYSSAGSTSPTLRADTILIVKHERKLYLLRDSTPLRSFRIALGLSPTGAKEREWDFRTPEGSYIIDFRQEHSHYFKALHISYPSAADLRRASELHRPVGGNIFIHGEPNQPSKPVSYYQTRDWTNGCVALSDEDLQDVWDLTSGQTRVEIVP